MKSIMIALVLVTASMGTLAVARNPFGSKPKAASYMASKEMVDTMKALETDWDNALISGDKAKLESSTESASHAKSASLYGNEAKGASSNK